MSAPTFSVSYVARLPGERTGFEASAPDLRGAFDQNRDPFIAAQRADLSKTEAQRRASQMVKDDRPKPVQRPGPALAQGPDGAAFNARWRAEQAVASREARKAEFKADRRAQSQFRAHTQNHEKGDAHER